MDWDDLHTFLAIARAGTLSGAAQTIGVTQPTMGRRLAAMEQRCGARLLERRPGGFTLTALGEAVLGNAERIEAEVIAAERLVTGRDIALEGTVRITTVDALASRIVVPAMAALSRTHPGITVELMSDTRSVSLSKREADIAVRVARFEGHEIVTRKLGEVAFGFYASLEYLRRVESTRPPVHQPTHQIVTVMDDQQHLPEARWLRENFPQARIALASNSREIHLRACKEGLGVACLAAYRARLEQDLVPLPQPGPMSREIWMGLHSDMRHMPRIKAVTEALTRAFKVKGEFLSMPA